MAEPKIDTQRAHLCHLHVRALNNQYASWVQSQLQNHPDELWMDGAQDYINHASGIMEKFSDVVAWLERKAPKADSTPVEAVFKNEKDLVDGCDDNKSKSICIVSNVSTTDGMVSHKGLWSSALSSGSQKPVFQGSQKSFTKPEASEDVDEESEEKPSSPSLKRTEEKGIVAIHEVKCKLYVKPDNPSEKGWKDMGVGQLSIKCKEGAGKATRESKPTVVIRNDVGKILLNALIYPGIKINVQKNTIASVFHTSVNGNEAGSNPQAVARTYLLRMKNEDETAKLAAAIKEYSPST